MASKSMMVALCMVLAVSSAYAARDLKQTKTFDVKQGVGFSFGYNLGWALGLLGFNTADAQTNSYTWGKGVNSVNTVTPYSKAQIGAGAGAAAGGGLSWNLFGKKGNIGAQNAIAATAANAANSQTGSTTNQGVTNSATANASSGVGTGKSLDIQAKSTIVKALVAALNKKHPVPSPSPVLV